MPLVRNGQIVEDRYLTVADDAPLPDGVPVIVPAARLLADADEISRREAPTGVVWPNDRRIAELEPHLHRLALVALQFPAFKDGRAYSQARQLRERHGFRGEMRATGQVLRDQFMFLQRAGFDSFAVTKESDAAAFADALRRFSVFYQPTGDGRPIALQARLAREPRPATDSPDPASALERRLANATPQEIVAEAICSVPRGRIAVASSFGIESAALLALVAAVDKSVPVLFLDTGWLFDETLAYRDELVARLGLTDVRALKPDANRLAAADPKRDLWLRNSDACCHIRKVLPLAAALTDFDAWINGRKRYQGGERASLPVVERDGERLKFNPFARISRAEINTLFERAGLPRHPLAASGYLSLGCIPCTERTGTGEFDRAGRWRGRIKSECGIHRDLPRPRDFEPATEGAGSTAPAQLVE
jgi:phosphoadenosine phosphosulfate reductase